jgi:hypothetical protein
MGQRKGDLSVKGGVQFREVREGLTVIEMRSGSEGVKVVLDDR